MSLEEFGWDATFQDLYAARQTPEFLPARVVRSAASIFRVRGAEFDLQATLAGRLRHDALTSAELPTVGDWVVVSRTESDEARIEGLLPRRSQLSRKVAGKRMTEQVVAANVDLVLVVMGLDGDFNLRRLERYLTAVSHSGAHPCVLLNKSDLCADLAARVTAVAAIASGAPVLPVSCKSAVGIAAVRELFGPGRTGVLVGSSGVGKSTLINSLLGEEIQPTREVREFDQRGRHTTTHRELFQIPGGGLLIDSPGIRELQLWGGELSLALSFDDLNALAKGCRYRDCGHQTEADCAVRQAVADGTLEAKRLESYHALQKELRHLETKQNESAQREQKQKWRGIQKEYRRFTKKRGH